VFEGEFKNDIENGFGKEEWPDHSSFSGFYVEGVKEGFGK